MNLYEINQQAYANLPDMNEKDRMNKIEDVANFIKQHNGEFYMLMCHELRYYTIFQKKKNWNYKMASEIDDIMQELGALKGVEVKDNAIEFWVSTDEGCNMYVLFNYDKGVIRVG